MPAASFSIATAPPAGDIEPDDLPEPTTSALERIKSRLAQARKEAEGSLTFRLPIPRMPMVVVEYRAVGSKEYNGLVELMGKTKMDMLEMQKRMLAMACEGVYLEDGEDILSADLDHPEEPAPCFDARLAKALSLPWSGLAYEFVSALYVTDGDVAATSTALMNLSGYNRAYEIEASARGN